MSLISLHLQYIREKLKILPIPQVDVFDAMQDVYIHICAGIKQTRYGMCAIPTVLSVIWSVILRHVGSADTYSENFCLSSGESELLCISASWCHGGVWNVGTCSDHCFALCFVVITKRMPALILCMRTTGHSQSRLFHVQVVRSFIAMTQSPTALQTLYSPTMLCMREYQQKTDLAVRFANHTVETDVIRQLEPSGTQLNAMYL